VPARAIGDVRRRGDRGDQTAAADAAFGIAHD
jgi:hypothetical protein